MKQKITRLQRWLDRLAAACESRKWNSAVAEADCLSAELKQVREELWEEAEAENVKIPLSVRAGNMVFSGAKSFAVAIIIICLTTLPIAVESGIPSMSASLPSVSAGRSEEFAIVTSEEKELLTMLRRSLNDSNVAVRAAEIRSPDSKRAFSSVPVQKRANAPTAPAQAGLKAENNKIKPEDLLTLVQIGEKSLRGGEPAIKIVN
ncbi:MAG: hypothetical protein SOR75_10990 [Synergistes jonesii]|uniref:hypothetical protein n=1 Tax=Synergistes jonesii TaxID=2754 RepID=UPI002A757B4C|nr:hypothetical protein [Synergistes jonesii]MDY2985842.1 hypothetical protein [Synergistes jonesii]